MDEVNEPRNPPDDGVFQNPENGQRPVPTPIPPVQLIQDLERGIGAMIQVAATALAESRASRLTIREALLMRVTMDYASARVMGQAPGDVADTTRVALDATDKSRLFGYVQAIWGLLQTQAADVIREMSEDIHVSVALKGFTFPESNRELYNWVYAPLKKGKAR